MKKNLVLLCGLAASVGLLTACGSGSGGQSQPAASDGSQTETTAKAQGGDGAKGKVYYLNFKPEQDGDWQNLAKKYTEETGVPVTVVTAASGTYEPTLMAEISKSEAPTLFQVNGPVGLKNWQDYCYDLDDAAILKELTSDSYALKGDDGKIKGVAYVIETYGIITNKTLLEKAGYKAEEIQSFADLKKVAEDITARKDELGFAAFTSAGMDSSSDWRYKTHLANLPIYFEYQADKITSTDAIKGTYLDNYKDIFDLYINNSTVDPKELSAKTADDSRNEFLDGKAVFYQNGSWEYKNILDSGKLKDEDLTMIPIYIGVGDEAKQGLCTGTENYWCVNNMSSKDDIQATLDFIDWCVTSEVGTKTMAEDMQFVIPFKKALPSDNVFVKEDAKLTEEGKVPVSWNFTTMPSQNWKDEVGSALTVYAADQTPDNWSKVVTAFVDGWKSEVAASSQN